MKIFFSPFKKKAYQKALSYMFWNPEYSHIVGRKGFLGECLCILHKKDKDTIEEARVNLIRENYRLPEDILKRNK